MISPGWIEPDWIAPGRTALLIIDMQRDFAGVPGAEEAMGRAARLVASAREAGVAVIFTVVRTRPETDSPAWRERLTRLGRDASREMDICREGSAGAGFAGPQPHPDEHIVPKRGYSAFSGTDLAARLAARGTDTLVLCGLTTECCVEASARDAFERDFHVFIAEDACAGSEPALHAAALTALARHYAILAGSEAICAGWAR